MRKNLWFRYLFIIIFLSILIFLKEYIVRKIQLDYYRNFEMNFLHYIFIPLIFNVLIGILLGMDHFMNEIKKEGSWHINLPKIELLGIPSLLFSLTFLFGYMGLTFANRLLSQTSSLEGNYIAVFQIIFGFTCITCLYKGNKM
ncbi:hypothetical protein EDD66_11730 [Mobilisporobacter senegalensis]|uniref:Uncharacterized protein n=1 Tax=Mobilisporobacter senegalensis TaxID=1329262 RepID=A0A3N1X809_9FIRM|nr:hypothetical protein [Mobilisporobacter senegalensis]ROR22118.1 hypothetical protein EDD66_11730 [Mobilisporobacter senegalensis]